jgi:hypothetical protein
MIAAAHHGSSISAGVDHPAYAAETGPLSEEIRASLAADLQPGSIN